MTESCVLQGRRIEPAQFLQVRDLVATHPEWSRYRLSRELCVLWDWRTPTGQWKDMAARTLMLKLAERGWIRLPERRALSPNRHRLAPPPPRSWLTTPITGIGYLKSPAYVVDNNLVENSIRGPAVGRRRWLFIGHPDAGWRSAVIYSFIVSCRRRGINPQDYLNAGLFQSPAPSTVGRKTVALASHSQARSPAHPPLLVPLPPPKGTVLRYCTLSSLSISLGC